MNIASAAVGHVPDDGDEGVAVMVVTTDQAVGQDVIDAILATEGFLDGRAVSLHVGEQAGSPTAQYSSASASTRRWWSPSSPASSRWRAAGGLSTSLRTSASSSAQPRSAACGMHASTTSWAISATGTRGRCRGR